MSTKNQTKAVNINAISSNNNLKAYKLTDSQYKKIYRPLRYLALKAKRTNEWFTFKEFPDSQGNHYVIFELDKDSANRLISGGKQVPIQILGKLHKLGNKTNKTAHQINDRFTVSFLGGGKEKGRQMSKLIANDLQGSQLGEVVCSACGRRQKNRVQLWAVKKLNNDQFDKNTGITHQYSYLGNECVKQGFLNTDISLQQIDSLIDRINEVEQVLDDAPTESVAQIYRSFDVQLNHMLEKGYQDFSYRLKAKQNKKSNKAIPAYQLTGYAKQQSLINKIQALLSNNNDEKHLLNSSCFSYELKSYDTILAKWSKMMGFDSYESAVLNYLHGVSEQFEFFDEEHNDLNQMFTNTLQPYRIEYKKLIQNVKRNKLLIQEYSQEFEQREHELLGDSTNEIEEEYPEQLYIQNVLDTIKSNRQLDNEDMRNAREIVMAVQENKVFVPSLIPKMKNMIWKALANYINPQLIDDFSNNEEIDKVQNQLDQLKEEYNNKFVQLNYQNILDQSQDAGNKIYTFILRETQLIQNKISSDEAKERENNPIKYTPWSGKWSNYTFNDEEKAKLRSGETITILWDNYKQHCYQYVTGKLGFGTFKKQRFFGFQVAHWGRKIRKY